jgi:hypothetical protein
MKRCHKCGAPWESERKQPKLRDFCAQCSAWLHSCMNCRFHDTRLHNECRIPTTDWVAERAGANFCDEFEFRDESLVQAEAAERNAAYDAAARLFGGDLPGKPVIAADFFEDANADAPRPKRFEDLFRE